MPTAQQFGLLLPLLVFGLILTLGISSVTTCLDDCAAEDRVATRPWHQVDSLGNELSLTRPYPYFQAALDNEYGDDLLKSGMGEGPSPFSQFCKTGCRHFHATFREPTLLSDCTDECEYTYNYTITVGYSDVIEIARLECRDGCQYALERCEPGHYCSQVRVIQQQDNVTHNTEENRDNDNALTYIGGVMRQCPPGMYRDVSYDAVESCIPCPRGRYRERTRGTSLDSCQKCPIGTYTTSVGSSSKDLCLRCPAGTFTTEPGSAECKCITPGACATDQLSSPADAEKRDTVPFVGRW